MRGYAARETDSAGRDFELVRAAHERATGNRWTNWDSKAYDENGIRNVRVEKILSTLQAVVRRIPAKINSFNYFVKEIVAVPDPCNRASQRKQLEKIVRRI